MINLAALLRTRAKWDRRATGIFTATFEAERRAVLRLGRRGFDTTRWIAALRVVWQGAALDWIPQVEAMLPEPKAKQNIPDELAEDLIGILAGKADAIVELTEEQWLLLGEEALDASAGRVSTMATTEANQSLAWSQHGTARESKLTLLKVWVAINDDRTRDSHRTAHGQRRRINDPFSVGGSSLQWPADAGGPLGEIVNCRCWEDYELAPTR